MIEPLSAPSAEQSFVLTAANDGLLPASAHFFGRRNAECGLNSDLSDAGSRRPARLAGSEDPKASLAGVSAFSA